MRARSLIRPNPGLLLLLAVSLGATGCSHKKVVTRIDPSTVTDLSGRWNDTDSRLVSEEMIKDCLGTPWIAQYAAVNNGKSPVVLVGGVRNKTSEHIAVETFISDVERALVNSGRATVAAGGDVREQLRKEREEQGDYASSETAKQFGRETGADYMMTGTISSIEDKEGGEQVVYYQVDLTLSNIESGAKSWIGQKKIKKFISRSKYKG
jgi:penicillin-binding protein activator